LQSFEDGGRGRFGLSLPYGPVTIISSFLAKLSDESVRIAYPRRYTITILVKGKRRKDYSINKAL
jgi:hypothetical protein